MSGNSFRRRMGVSSERASRAAAYSCVTVLAVLVTVITANIAAGKFVMRWDLTATSERTLAARTKVEIARLEGHYRFVIVADQTGFDSRSRRRVEDVLKEMHSRGANFGYSIIDTSSPRGIAAYQRLLWDLTEREALPLREQTKAVELGMAGVSGLSTYLTTTLAPALMEIHDALPGSAQVEQVRAYLQQAAARARLASRDLLKAATDAQDSLRNRVGDIPLPLSDSAAATIVKPLGPAVDFLAQVHKDLASLAASDLAAGPPAERARAQLDGVEQQRSAGAVLADSLRRLERLDLTRVVDVLKSSQCALLIGPQGKGLVAVDIEELYPRVEYAVEGSAAADLSRRVEDVIASALSALRAPERPIAVLVHGENGPFIDDIPMFASLMGSLRRKGIDLIEWPAVLSADGPSLASVDPRGQRPVVYIVLSPDSTAAAKERGQLTGAQRAEKLGLVVQELIARGKPVLMNLNPSVAPSYGQSDPLASALAAFGLTADTGRPLFRELSSPRGKVVETDRMVQPVEGPHALTGAVLGLPTYLPWPVAILDRPLPAGTRAKSTSLYELAADSRTWAESQWTGVWTTPREKRGAIAELPKFDASQDARWPEGRDTGKPQAWRVAVASERFEVGKPPQRLVVVGSNSWFMDAVTSQTASVDGRRVPAYPGNSELFESAVWWLAGQDDLIAQSPTAQAVSIIQPMSEALTSRVRLAVIVGLPASILMLGLLARLIRG
ncbi:MAG: hypothetical protein ACOYN0_09260 [Phycisphaerales bacterium]